MENDRPYFHASTNELENKLISSINELNNIEAKNVFFEILYRSKKKSRYANKIIAKNFELIIKNFDILTGNNEKNKVSRNKGEPNNPHVVKKRILDRHECIFCGSIISSGRLKALPDTRKCIDCAREDETKLKNKRSLHNSWFGNDRGNVNYLQDYSIVKLFK